MRLWQETQLSCSASSRLVPMETLPSSLDHPFPQETPLRMFCCQGLISICPPTTP